MNLYLISQNANDDYDTYDAAVVAANNEDEARNINPNGEDSWNEKYSSWCSSPEQVSVKYIGIATEETERGIILASFNAG